MTSVTEILLSPGDLLYCEGSTNEHGFIVASGELVLFRTVNGVRIDVERRGAGTIVGELSILTGRPRLVSVEALTECRVYQISASQIISRFENLDPVLRACIETSINFNGTISKRDTAKSPEVPLAPSTLRNADRLIEQFQLETDLIKGFQNGEFFLLYQPIVDMSDGSVTGVEALMRWVHPTLGFVPPDRFIQIAEAMGAISNLTDFALLEASAALARFRALPDAPSDLFASVNISGADIGRSCFVDILSHAADLHSLEPHHIKLEITETALITDQETADRNLSRLRDLGYGISVDDFGTGYSNLAYLKSLPLTTLKIDRAFAGDAHSNSVSRGIVRMLLTLGNELGVDIIAEGVETLDDVETLTRLGCRYAQGYYFHKPMPEQDIIKLISGASKHCDVA